MTYVNELKFEADVVKKLTEHGWSKNILKNKTEEELLNNWAEILYNNNKGIDRLNNQPLTEGEKSQLLEQIKKLRSPLNLNKFVNGKTIYIKRDNPNDLLHLGKEVPLDIYDRNQIAGGKSVYQICEQPIFKTRDPMVSDRRGDILLLINGMPLIHVELKRSGVPVSQAIEQIKKYSHEHAFSGLFSLVQVFVAMNPEETKYFANPGEDGVFNDRFYFKWADKNNEPFNSWDKNIENLLSIPMAHKLIGFYTVPDNGDGILKVMRSYQYYACEAINSRVEKAEWTAKDRLGGYICHTTGSGKTMTSFKAAQLLAQSKRSDKVVFLIDRIELGTQSAGEYRNFKDEREDVQETEDTYALISKLKSSDPANTLIVTSIQKMSNIQLDEGVNARDIEKINKKKIVFIVDECHRSTFGEMLAAIKQTFPTAIYFGFTGTPIYEDNKKHDNTTTTVFGNELHRYSIADGIRDGNVLGFDPSYVLTYTDKDIRTAVALREANASDEQDAMSDPRKQRIFQEMSGLPMVGRKDENGKYIKGIEDYISASQYKLDKGDPENGIPAKPLGTQHPYLVVKDILENWNVLSVNGKFHAIFATSSIPEAIDYYHLFKQLMGTNGLPVLKIAGIFDESIGNDSNAIPKEDALKEMLKDYNKEFNQSFTIPRYQNYKKDVAKRLAHKKEYLGIEKQHPEMQLNIVIVVDQMLTGFDSKWVNTLYLDKVLKFENLVQAFSRTNRIFGKDKPFGIVKWYRYPHTMEKMMDDAFELYSGSNPYGVFVEKLEDNLKKMNATFALIKSIFDIAKIENFSTIEPLSVEEKAKFAKEFAKLAKLINSAIIQGFVWNKDTYTFEHGPNGSDTIVKVLFDENTFKILALRYKELFSAPADQKKKEDNLFDIDATAIEIHTDKIDAVYLNSKFKKWLSALYDGEEENIVNNLSQQLHESFPTLSQEDQKYANQILFDIQNGTLILNKNDSHTFGDYINQYKAREKNDQIHKFASKIGYSEDILRNLVNERPTEANINVYGRFDALRNTLDADKAQEYFSAIEGKKIPKPLAKSKAENLARDFIIKGGYDL